MEGTHLVKNCGIVIVGAGFFKLFDDVFGCCLTFDQGRQRRGRGGGAAKPVYRDRIRLDLQGRGLMTNAIKSGDSRRDRRSPAEDILALLLLFAPPLLPAAGVLAVESILKLFRGGLLNTVRLGQDRCRDSHVGQNQENIHQKEKVDRKKPIKKTSHGTPIVKERWKDVEVSQKILITHRLFRKPIFPIVFIHKERSCINHKQQVGDWTSTTKL